MGQATFSGPVKIVNGLQAGTTGTILTLIIKGSITVDLPSALTGASGTVNVTLTGAAVNDFISVAPRALTTGLVVGQAFVSAADTVTIRFINGSAGTIDQASATWDYVLIRS